MSIRTLILLLACSCCIWQQTTSAFAVTADTEPVNPITNHGKKWRIGYVEGGPYGSFTLEIRAIVESLMQMGWIEPKAIPPASGQEDAGRLWHWLATEIKSDTLEFVEDAFYSANWDADRRVQQRALVIERLHDRYDLDLLLAFGTWAGQDLATDANNVNTIILEVTDAEESGIIKSPSDSGRPNIYADINPERYIRQLDLFHTIFGFNTLGVVYEDSEEGRSICSLDKIQEVARERGFTIVPCFVAFKSKSQEQAERDTAACYEKLAAEVDSVYVTYHPGVSLHNLPNIVRPLLQNNIPSFTQGTNEEVQRGILFSVSPGDYRLVGRNQAQIIAKVFNGAKPGSLQQPFRTPLMLTINLKTAQMIGYNPSINILSSADEIYQAIRQD